ncbi:hypothetical protein [Ramlibacter sp. WS9]|uniref:hypothetical protein n=1 Tax=Ramlibacter sp. WS9 TaxID=1882741 RepID=UPI001141FC8E|nr:hypothetical protein [Ramlibacter sp. WS9]ROZ72474.1 hypothetical protein EEB15_19775 [Ramlibacter sp. WS9]
MTTHSPAAGPRTDDRDVSWMEETYPLHEELIQAAIDQLSARNERASLARGSRAQAAEPHQRGKLHTRVTGPVDGYYVASFASQAGKCEAAFVGEYKVFEVRPNSYWSAQSVVGAGTCRHSESTGAGAMERAEALAATSIALRATATTVTDIVL